MGEYSGSYLEQLVTGSTQLYNVSFMEQQLNDLEQGDRFGFVKKYDYQRYLRAGWRTAVAEARGVKRSASGQPRSTVPPSAHGRHSMDSLLSISGSFNRFVSLPDQSEIYYDSLLPNIGEIFQKKGTEPCRSAIFGIADITGPGSVRPPMFNVGAEALANSFVSILDTTQRNSLNTLSGWQHSFPFEEKWLSENPTRLIEPKAGLGVELGRGQRKAFDVDNGNAWSTIGGGGFTRSPEQGANRNGSLAERDQTMWTMPLTVQMAETSNVTLLLGDLTTGLPGAAPMTYPQAEKIYSASRRQPELAAARLAGFWDGEFSVSGSATVLCNYYFTKGVHNVTRCLAGFTHPSGWRHGLMNFRPTATNCIFRPDKYGQLRDMFEQRRYTKFYDKGTSFDMEGVTDAAVSCIFLDGDGRPVDDPLETSCYNVSTTMTSSRPYIDGSTEDRIITSRYVSIDF